MDFLRHLEQTHKQQPMIMIMMITTKIMNKSTPPPPEEIEGEKFFVGALILTDRFSALVRTRASEAVPVDMRPLVASGSK